MINIGGVLMKKKINEDVKHIIARLIQIVFIIIGLIIAVNIEEYLFFIILVPALLMAVEQLVEEVNEIFKKKGI